MEREKVRESEKVRGREMREREEVREKERMLTERKRDERKGETFLCPSKATSHRML